MRQSRVKSGQTAAKPAGTFSRLSRYVGKHPWLLAAVVLCALLGNIALLTAPRLIGDAIDLIVVGEDFRPAMLPLLLWIAGLFAIGCVLLRLTALAANEVANRTVQRLRLDVFQKLGRLPLSYFDTHARGDIMNRFTVDIDYISDGLNQGIVQLISGVITVGVCLYFMLTLNPIVALVAVFVTPLCFLVGFFITKYGNRRFREQARTLGELNGYAEEFISGQRTVQAFGYEKQAQKRFGEINAELYQCGYRAQFASALVNPSTRFVNNVAYVLVGVFGLLWGLSAGGIASFLTYTAQFSKPFNEITAITMQIQLALASAKRVFGLLDEPEQVPDPQDAAELTDVQGRVTFEHVKFAYTPDRPLITDFNLSVEPGTTVAIVGPTGAGKTTLVNLLMRFYEVDGGRITVDGVDISHMTRDSLRRQFGMVLQETWLFEGTIRDNIAYGKPDATDEEIVAAAKAAHAHSFIRRLPDGYQTLIEEDGGNLSGGQKQLLTIARAMLSNPPMLILDEATSSVDILTEMRIQKAFLKLMEGKTSFVIAHRLSTIRDAEIILVLRDGDVVEAGTHEELLQQGGFYSELYNSQFACA